MTFLGTIVKVALGLALIVLGLMVLIAVPLSIRTFLFQPFNIPSEAMAPTILAGDYIFVAKYSYGYSRYSLPLSPAFSGRIFASEPKLGDIAVFRHKDETTDYIKRIVGLPGDRIQMINGLLHINGKPVEREQVEDYVGESNGKSMRAKQWRETLPNGVTHYTLDLLDNGFLDNTQVYNVPPGDYFMMGDNRDNSSDSRILSQIGYVPLDKLIGRAAIIFWSTDRDSKVRIERVAKSLQ
jgi:signal peptidase I